MAVEPCVQVEVAVMGPIENNVYIIDDGNSVVVVDPTQDAPRIMSLVGDRQVGAIVLTHAHWDHVGAAKALRDLSGAPVAASAVDAPFIDGSAPLDPSHRSFDPCPVDRLLSDGDELVVGNMRWRVLATPGHTPGSICLLLEPRYGSNPQGAPVLIAGDTLFAGAHGRTDFVGGDPAEMRVSLRRLAELAPDTLVLPGHNSVTTIARELGWLSRGSLF